MTQTDLFQPVTLGPLVLSNRIVMAPLTRSRAGKGDVPGPLNAEYYRQRAHAGLIVSEATNISQQGKGYAFTPGIYTDEQVAGWRLVTDAVHAAGGVMFCQLWHVGRISHPSLQPGGGLPVSASAVKAEGQAFTERGFQPFVTPRALETGEIPGLIADYVHAAECAKRAGFDGVEIHAANGYLLEQFLRSKTNQRTDAYGGSVENRARLVLEVADAVGKVWGRKQTGIRLSPVSPANDMGGAAGDAQEVYEYVVRGLDQLGLGYMHIVEGATQGPRDNMPFDYAKLKSLFTGLYMANNNYDLALAEAARAEYKADLIAFGRPFITNPDLVERLRLGLPLAPSTDKTHWYGGGAEGYTDYPTASRRAA
jgi:N-ethylmaleimide reductase